MEHTSLLAGLAAAIGPFQAEIVTRLLDTHSVWLYDRGPAILPKGMPCTPENSPLHLTWLAAGELINMRMRVEWLPESKETTRRSMPTTAPVSRRPERERRQTQRALRTLDFVSALREDLKTRYGQ